ncbi:Aste57867_6837 [Aphanomyces stellatus]|uniref:Aste57867_6837 protein n=1 Tax=Aphanomyces stellatus TaxID=120398 RepID=A0A485KGP4_9STRA|nr:hypothetical protein As57867_006816 [Aphanomyces stellatus]VFT83799.1 Aste57867_6837 [Aphanomyces stellatus]
MQRVAHFIETRDSFFCFLEAFVGTDALGPLQRVWGIPLRTPRNYLWPHLTFAFKEFDQYPSSFSAVIPCFPAVRLRGQVDWALLRHFIQSSTPVEWICESPNWPSIGLWMDQLRSHHIVSIEVLRIDVGIVDMLPFLPHLRQLKMTSFDDATTHTLVNYLHHSNISQLTLWADPEPEDEDDDPPQPRLTNFYVWRLTQWIANKPVRALDLAMFNICANKVLMKTFYDTVFTRLQHYGHSSMPLTGFETYAFARPLLVMSLNMSPAGLNSSTLTMLGAGLLNSNVTTLDLSCNKIDRSGVSALAQAWRTLDAPPWQRFCPGHKSKS